ncbi:putative aspartokinase [Ceratocystis lukuohia]|uniref:Aspartokinase n=3 Tax=Ceratocystis TaxID=5157 RepID=A0A0F8CXU8_CERFI|nr:putative aspartokinase [Ceratocystis platani]PHH55973.1 Aspartate kinase FUB3 [Ceratocystis fimbriata CBS 114723]
MSQLLDNAGDLGWVVQKFGGTSVGKFPDKIAVDIVRQYLSRNKVIVVCSARSTGKKAEGTTSRLLTVFSKLLSIGSHYHTEEHRLELVEDARALVKAICDDHLQAVSSFIKSPEIQATLTAEITRECDELVEYIVAAKRFNLEIKARAKDRVVSFGEKLSCRFMAALLQDVGVDAAYVDLSDRLHFDLNARLDANFYAVATAGLRAAIDECGVKVPVVTGFFGNVPGSLIDGDIGRGYTDLCAALCAVGVAAEELQIWKEVDGIFTADPTKVPTARLLPSITPSEAAELTFYGSEVIHHLTMEQVTHAQPPIPIRIKNVKNPVGNGTIVIPDGGSPSGKHVKPKAIDTTDLDKDYYQLEPSVETNGVSDAAQDSTISKSSPKRPTAVTIKDNITVINVHSNKRSISHGFFARIFSILDRHKISVDLISTSEVHVSMAVHAACIELGVFDSAIKALQVECGEVSVLPRMAILSLIGAEMKDAIGISGKMFKTLGDHNINIEMISQGASEINISCVIDAANATRAMNVLHTHLFTFLD